MSEDEAKQAEALRVTVMRTATGLRRDAFGTDGRIYVGVDLGAHGDRTAAITAVRNVDGSITVIDSTEREP